jgi:hypothetical protein
MKPKLILFICFALMSISASPVMLEYVSEDDSYSGGGGQIIYYPSVTYSAADILIAWDSFALTLQETSQETMEITETNPAVVEEVIMDNLTLYQQTIKVMQDIMRRIQETMQSIIRNMR